MIVRASKWYKEHLVHDGIHKLGKKGKDLKSRNIWNMVEEA